MAREYPPITTLIPNLKTGDRSSWNSLVRLFTPALTGKAHVLLRNSPLRSRIDPDDLVGEVFAKAWKHHALIQGKSTYQIAKWLLTIMVNTFRDHCRKGGLPETSQPDWEAPVASNPSPSSAAEAFEDEVKLHAVMASLDEADRRVLILKYWHGLTHEQIAAEIGTSKASVTRLVQRLLPQLSTMMES